MELTLTESKTFSYDLDSNSFMGATRLIEKVNDYQIVLEVDIDILSIRKFIALLVEQCSFSEISIKELPMEGVITRIYKKNG